MARSGSRDRRVVTLRRFAVRLLLSVAVIALLWSFAAPLYNRFVAVTAGAAFALIESPDVTIVRAEQGALWILREARSGDVKPFMSFDLYVYVGFVPLLALLLATPGLRPWRRLRLLGFGVALLSTTHIVFLVGAVRLLYVAYGLDVVGPMAAGVCQWAQVSLRILWEAGALVIWAALALRAWRRSRPAVGLAGTPAHAAGV
ncbi:MAG: hypothetical protein JSW65_03875 [Candidatus Bipolaricaulota bacterium]|nr:MAG: hypothetical protein JSW65_03875 [Candidatus Bipolaricaulota bacterium]